MRWVDQIRITLLMLFRRNRADTRLEDELQFHLDRQIAENISDGMTPDEARYAALRTFGNPALLRDETHSTWSWNWLESLVRDLRFASRNIRRAPGFAALMVLTLAIGIGANTAIFLLTWTILLRGLPVPNPGELIRYTFRKADSDIGLSYPQYLALEKQQRVASGIFAWHDGDATLRSGNTSENVSIAMATGHVFEVLELKPWLGAGFASDAGEQGSDYRPEALISYDFWQTRFHSDPAIGGRALNLANQNVTVIGVLPPGFDGVQSERRISILLPLSFETVLHGKSSMMQSPGAFWLTVMGRLRPGETLKKAHVNLAAIQRNVNDAADPSHAFLNGGFFSGYALGVDSGRSGRSWLRMKYGKALLILEGLCLVMMLLCAVNAALLVLSRVTARLQEFAMRSALGATRRRLIMQVFTETSVLALCGLCAGTLLGWEVATVLVGMLSGPSSPPVLHLQMGAAVVLFASAVTMVAALAAGIWPAWRASRTAPITDLKQTGAERTSAHLGRWIIPTQVALGVLMLNAALLLTGTLRAYLNEDSGFRPDNVVLAQLETGSQEPAQSTQAARVLEFFHRIQGMPGVKAATLLSMAPISNGFSVSDFYSRDEHGSLRVNRQIWPESVSPQYFAVMGTRMLQGRTFSSSDAQGESTCILSQSAAAFFFPGRSPLGESLNSGDGTEKASDRESCRVIGIAADARIASLLQPAPPVVYLPIERAPADAFTYSSIGVRAANSQLAADAVRRAFSRVFPGAPLPKTFAFRDAINSDLSRQRLLGGVSGGFAVLALALLATGLYGILSRTVTERRRDIGIRMALGAKRQQIVVGLVRTAAVRIGIGLLAGALMAVLAARLLHSQLFGVSFQSPAIVVCTLCVLLLVLILAFMVPVGRAASVDPMQALRME